jgi:hypothetical protein
MRVTQGKVWVVKGKVAAEPVAVGLRAVGFKTSAALAGRVAKVARRSAHSAGCSLTGTSPSGDTITQLFQRTHFFE